MKRYDFWKWIIRAIDEAVNGGINGIHFDLDNFQVRTFWKIPARYLAMLQDPAVWEKANDGGRFAFGSEDMKAERMFKSTVKGEWFLQFRCPVEMDGLLSEAISTATSPEDAAVYKRQQEIMKERWNNACHQVRRKKEAFASMTRAMYWASRAQDVIDYNPDTYDPAGPIDEEDFPF
jgi:hypothetical protein